MQLLGRYGGGVGVRRRGSPRLSGPYSTSVSFSLSSTTDRILRGNSLTQLMEVSEKIFGFVSLTNAEGINSQSQPHYCMIRHF
jgi:hypothetical protein